MKKLLSVAVPCYNVKWCLEKCLSSFITEPLLEGLEVIVVNDGSTDGTQAIAERYAKRYPSVFKTINKQNGGHGSTINAAIKQAAGKYFTAVDADDWIQTENLQAFLEELSKTEADAVITHYHTVDMTSGNRKEYLTKDITLNKIYSLDEYTSLEGTIFECASYHGLTYRTQTYKDSGAILSEGIFYEDHEYATLPFVNVKTVLPLDMFLYQYLIGNENQSVAEEKQVKQLGHLEQVIRRLFQCHRDNPEISQGARRYIAHKATDLLISYYVIAMIKNPDKPGGRKTAAGHRRDLQTIDHALVKATDRRYKLAVLMSRLRFKSDTLRSLKRRLPYGLFRKWYK